jgi:hypothetical protein
MELIAAILLAGPLGYFGPTPGRGRLYYLLAWAVIFPIQTVVVWSMDDSGQDYLYFVVNAAILCLGLNAVGARLRRERRPGHVRG